jgi:hypothetical protein
MDPHLPWWSVELRAAVPRRLAFGAKCANLAASSDEVRTPE